MGLLIGHVAGVPIEEVLMPLSGLSIGLITASAISRIRLLRKKLG